MSMPMQDIEGLFLKIVKIAILAIMAIALLAIVFFMGNAAYQYSQTPKEPEPAKKAPVQEIKLDDLKQWLLEQERLRQKANEPAKEQAVTIEQTRVEYLADAQALYECSLGFAAAAEIALAEAQNNDAKSQAVMRLRAQLEPAAKARDWRGDPWIKAVVAFGCMVLKDPSIVALKKEGKISTVVFPTINFHLAAWDRIETEKRRFEQAEQNRVASERTAEGLRVGIAKAQALAHVISAGVAFGVFMALALYLVFAKIETNLRAINESIRAGGAAR